MLVLDGVYVTGTDPAAAPIFRPASAPAVEQLQRLLERISHRIGRYLEHCGGKTKIIASIEAPATIRRILEYLERHARGPPVR
jgi:hypothetical protein